MKVKMSYNSVDINTMEKDAYTFRNKYVSTML